MMKPLLSASTLALSLITILGSPTVFAEIVTTEGIRVTPGYYYFSDSRLDSNLNYLGKPNFAELRYEENYIHLQPVQATYRLTVAINPDNPYVFNSDTVRGATDSLRNFVTESGEIFPLNDDPVAIMSKFSIFDLDQSFVHYNDGRDRKISLAEAIRESSGLILFSLNTLGDSDSYADLFWSVGSGGILPYRPTGITLAYNLPIPEPETWAMLLAGLGIVGAVTRRQRARAAM